MPFPILAVDRTFTIWMYLEDLEEENEYGQ